MTLAIILSLVIFTATGYVVYRVSQRAAEEVPAQTAPIEHLRFQRITDFGNVVFPTISPDGRMLAFVLNILK